MKLGQHLISLALTAVAFAQTCSPTCPNGAPPNTLDNSNGYPAYWAAGTSVTVYVNTSSFATEAEQHDIQEAFLSWQKTLSNANIQYFFDFASVTDANPMPPPGGPPNYILVQRGATGGFEDTVGINNYVTVLQGGAWHVLYSYITISPDVTVQPTDASNHGYLYRVLLHEIGHSYGLGNCTACRDGDTNYYSCITLSDSVRQSERQRNNERRVRRRGL